MKQRRYHPAPLSESMAKKVASVIDDPGLRIAIEKHLMGEYKTFFGEWPRLPRKKKKALKKQRDRLTA